MYIHGYSPISAMTGLTVSLRGGGFPATGTYIYIYIYIPKK